MKNQSNFSCDLSDINYWYYGVLIDFNIGVIVKFSFRNLSHIATRKIIKSYNFKPKFFTIFTKLEDLCKAFHNRHDRAVEKFKKYQSLQINFFTGQLKTLLIPSKTYIKFTCNFSPPHLTYSQ